MVEDEGNACVQNARARLTECKQFRQGARDMEAACDAMIAGNVADAQVHLDSARHLRKLADTWTKDSSVVAVAGIPHHGTSAPRNVDYPTYELAGALKTGKPKSKKLPCKRDNKKYYAYAGFFPRFVAYVVDVIMMAVLSLILLLAQILIISIIFPGIRSNQGAILSFLTLLIFIWLYNAGSESSFFMATPGKALLGIRVTDTDGKQISFWVATWRFMVKTFLCGGILDCLFILRNKNNQSIHDMLADTLVIYPPADPEDEFASE